MPKVVGVRFRTSPKMYWFSPTDGDDAYKKGTSVIVETQRGMEIATVVMPPKDVAEDEIVQPLKPVSRLATEEDISASFIDDEAKRGILSTAKQKVADRALDMKIVDCEYTVDRSKLVLYFTAEQRVDFRDLVRDLASAFHMRIDLRQISARDECKLIGCLGPCGMACCCGGFESDGGHVSIKMAKNQNLALTPGKINGMCGRLLCCLGYENKTYEDVLKRAPKHGAPVTAPDGRRGTVVSVTPLTEIVRVRFGDDDNFEFAEFPLSELSYEKRTEVQGANGEKPNGGQNGGGKKKGFDRRDRKNNGKDRPEKDGGAPDRSSKNDGKNRPAPQEGERRPHGADQKQQNGDQKPQSGKRKNRRRDNGNGGDKPRQKQTDNAE